MTTYNSLTDRTDAGPLAREEVSDAILQGLPTASAALGTFRRVNMTKSQTRMPVLSVLPVAYWVSGDTGLKQTSEVNWANKYLDARELAVIVPIPIAVVDDSDFDIAAEAIPRLIEAFGSKLDAAALMNVNNPWPQAYQAGIVTQAVAAGNSVTEGTGTDFADDVSLAMGKVEADGYDVNQHYARKKVRAHLRGLRASTREPIFQDLTATSPALLYGEPIAYVANDPWVNNYELITGDRSQAILGVRQDFSFKVFTEGVISDDSNNVVLNLMQQDAIAIRAVARFGFAVANPINLDNATDATRFPFAVVINAGS